LNNYCCSPLGPCIIQVLHFSPSRVSEQRGYHAHGTFTYGYEGGSARHELTCTRGVCTSCSSPSTQNLVKSAGQFRLSKGKPATRQNVQYTLTLFLLTVKAETLRLLAFPFALLWPKHVLCSLVQPGPFGRCSQSFDIGLVRLPWGSRRSVFDGSAIYCTLIDW